MTTQFESLPLIYNAVWAEQGLPMHEINIGAVPFSLPGDEDGHLRFCSVSPGPENTLASCDMYVSVPDVFEVYFLISTSFGLRVNKDTEWEGRQVGSIKLTSKEGGQAGIQLILGRNIRDWYRGFQPHAVFKLIDDQTVCGYYNPDTGASIDLMSVVLPKKIDLARISIEARLESTEPIPPATLRETRAKLVETEINPDGKKSKIEYSAELEKVPIETSYPRINIYGITCASRGWR